ncbi:MAG: serine/threonine protein kinase [Actinobacteria bacterium]|nr:serine/threonine protein kinase [Actinomycetota bacterium]
MVKRYRILREIGRGAMGRVYLAQDSLLERDVALKELKVPDYFKEQEKAEVRERFRLEAKAAAKLSHPHILTVHDIILDEDRQYIVMEYLEGKTMREVLAERRLSPGEVMSIAPMVCEALGYAHRQGIIHRDVKPDNIFVLQNGNIKLADFGIAKMIRMSDRTHTDVILGTPNYIAPEVIQGRPYDHRVDIFALGVTMYEMLSGRRPFDAENDFAILYKVVTEEPVPLSEVVDGVPPSLVRVVHKALRKDPSLRYRDMEEFRADLMEVRTELGMEVDGKEAFDKEKALLAELEAAREMELGEEQQGVGYDFRRDREWKELIARIYAPRPGEERGLVETSGGGFPTESEVGAAAERNRPPSVSPAYGVAGAQASPSRGRTLGHAWVEGAPHVRIPFPGGSPQPGAARRGFQGNARVLSVGARRLALSIPALTALLVISTLFPWIGRGLNPTREMAGISFPEGMLISGLATLIAGCDAMVLLGMLSPGKWTRAMKGLSLLVFLTALLFLGLRVFAGLGYGKAPGLSLGQALAGTGWGLWLALAGSLATFILCSRLRAEAQ